MKYLPIIVAFIFFQCSENAKFIDREIVYQSDSLQISVDVYRTGFDNFRYDVRATNKDLRDILLFELTLNDASNKNVIFETFAKGDTIKIVTDRYMIADRTERHVDGRVVQILFKSASK
jgi:hypothetical protein